MATATIAFDFGNPRVGLWCDACALPSVIEVDVLRLKTAGVQRVGTVVRCANDDHRSED